ncbi:MAG: flavodoxin domain-containing protein [Dehalococcoidales bacterium]
MKALVIYDSQYGNTEQIAKAIAEALGDKSMAVKIGQVKAAEIADYSYIIIGSPTQGGRPTAAIQTFLNSLTADVLAGKRFAAFDTRFKNVFAKIFGYAAPRIEAVIKAKGGNTTAQPQGFFVKSTKGPLMEGELERAATWAKAIAAGVPTNLMPGEYKVKTKE